TAAGTFPSQDTNQKLQANIVAAKYEEATLSLAPASAVDMPPGLQTFSPGSSQEATVTFRNTSGEPATGLKLSIAVPKGWTSVASGGSEASKTFTEPVAVGSTASATFKITSGNAAFNGDLVGNAAWTDGDAKQSAKAIEKVRNVSPVKINEFANGATES